MGGNERKGTNEGIEGKERELMEWDAKRREGERERKRRKREKGIMHRGKEEERAGSNVKS